MQKIINYCVFVFVYLIPFIFLINITYKKKKNKIIIFIALLAYTVIAFISSRFLMNLIPFIVVVFNLIFIKKSKDNHYNINYFEDYTIYNFDIRSIRIKKCIKYVLSSYGTVTIVSVAFYIIFTKFGIKIKQQEIINRMFEMSKNKLVFTSISAVVFAPVIEEFVFRYILFEKTLKRNTNMYLAVVLSSLIFAILHYNLKSFPMIFCIGCINCYLIEKKGYWYSVFNHSFFNLISVIGIVITRFYS